MSQTDTKGWVQRMHVTAYFGWMVATCQARLSDDSTLSRHTDPRLKVNMAALDVHDGDVIAVPVLVWWWSGWW